MTATPDAHPETPRAGDSVPAADADTSARAATVDGPEATSAVDEPSAPADAPALAPAEEIEETPLASAPVATAPFVPPELPPAVETAPVKWPADAGKEYLAPVDVVADPRGKRLFVAEFEAKRVAVFDVAGGGEGKVAPVPGPPGGLAISPDGTRLYVACSDPEGTVEILDAGTLARVASVRVGHTPMSPVVSPDGATLYVSNRFDNDVSVVDLASKREVKRIPVAREPVAAAITPDGKTLFVANHLPALAADGEYVGASVSVIDVAAGKTVAEVALPNGATGLRGVAVSPDGAHAYVTHLLSRYQLPTTQIERGWMNSNALSVVDARARKYVNTVLLDNMNLGAANPWGVACTADGRFICVTHAGANELSVIDAQALHGKLERVAAGQKVSDVSVSARDVPNDLSFLIDIRRRIALPGTGPRGLAAVGMMVYVAQHYSDDLAAVKLEETPGPAQARAISLGAKKPMAVERRGEMLFNSATICLERWQSCASCHPDGRSDGLNWDLMNDGLGNPKNTKSMLLSHRTPPAMITGVRAKAEVAVRSGIKFILFAERPEEEAAAIDAYLKSMQPVPSPRLAGGKLSEAAVRGKAVFAKADCGSCHSGPLLSDLKKHNVGTGVGSEKTQVFDTPTLVEVWRTAPFLYDGRAVTMAEVLKAHNKGDRHGKTSGLSAKDLEDLAEFVLSQ